jgi:protein TonB
MLRSFQVNFLLVSLFVFSSGRLTSLNAQNTVPGLNPGAPPAHQDALPLDDGVIAPILKSFVSPSYPKDALREHKGGTVRLWVIVDRDGYCKDVRVARSAGFGLDSSAVSAVRKWRFAPAQKNGQVVKVQIYIKVVFDSSNGSTWASLP